MNGVGGREAAGKAGEGAGDARERMAAGAVEHQGGERHQDDVHGVAREMAENGDDDDGGRERGGRDVAHQLAKKHMNEARAFGNADAERRDERDAERREAHEVLDRIDDQLEKVLGREHVHDTDHVARGRVLVVKRNVGKRARDHERDDECPDEEHRDVRQLVAGRLNHVQEAVEASHVRGCLSHFVWFVRMESGPLALGRRSHCTKIRIGKVLLASFRRIASKYCKSSVFRRR